MPPRLVAVSKKQPVEKIQLAYREGGLRHFGENYVRVVSFTGNGEMASCFVGPRTERQGVDFTGLVYGLWKCRFLLLSHYCYSLVIMVI